MSMLLLEYLAKTFDLTTLYCSNLCFKVEWNEWFN